MPLLLLPEAPVVLEETPEAAVVLKRSSPPVPEALAPEASPPVPAALVDVVVSPEPHATAVTTPSERTRRERVAREERKVMGQGFRGEARISERSRCARSRGALLRGRRRSCRAV